jgi:hypothetical protein
MGLLNGRLIGAYAWAYVERLRMWQYRNQMGHGLGEACLTLTHPNVRIV